MPKSEGPRGNATWSPPEVHVVNIDGTNDRVLYSVPRGQATHVQNFHITSPSPLPDGRAGAAYAYTLAATGGTTPYTWSLVAGALPAGVALSPAGLLSGQPTEAGTFSFVMQVTDEAGVQTSERFLLTVTPPALVLAAGDLPEALDSCQ